MRIVIDVLIVISIVFAFAGTVGMLRMPDFFTRLHPSTNIATFGILGVIIGGILYTVFVLHDSSMAVKIAVIGIFNLLANPIAAHALAKGAYRRDKKPKKNMVVDQLGEDMEAAENE